MADSALDLSLCKAMVDSFLVAGHQFKDPSSGNLIMSLIPPVISCLASIVAAVIAMISAKKAISITKLLAERAHTENRRNLLSTTIVELLNTINDSLEISDQVAAQNARNKLRILLSEEDPAERDLILHLDKLAQGNARAWRERFMALSRLILNTSTEIVKYPA